MKLRLKELRLAHDWTQRHVAEMARMSVSYYTEIELGKKQINGKRLESLAKVFGTTPQGLIAPDTTTVAGVAEAILQLPKESREVVEQLIKLLSTPSRAP